jgi:hypothetical protein
MPSQITLKFSFASPQEAATFGVWLLTEQRRLVTRDFKVTPPGEEFTSEGDWIPLVVSFLTGGGPQAIAAVAELLTELIRAFRQRHRVKAPRVSIGKGKAREIDGAASEHLKQLMSEAEK